MRHALNSWLQTGRGSRLVAKWILIQRRQSPYSSLSREVDVETLKIVCGSSGTIDVDLYNFSALQNPSSPLIVYLPPTGTHLRSSHPPIPRYLFHPLASLASIHYRWNIPSSPSSPTSLDDSISQFITPPPSPKLLSSDSSFTTYPFPTPLHDVLHAYSYLLQILLPQYSQTPPSSSSPTSSLTGTRRTLYSTTTTKLTQRPILIYGSYLGGTLATSLALTESFASKNLPTRIAGLISKNGIYDWTDIATTPPSLPNPSTLTDTLSEPESEFLEKGIWDSKILYNLREKLFREPGGAFDPFASPSLFFRTAGIPVPKTWPLSSDDNPTTTPVSPSAATPSPTAASTSSSPLINHIEEDIFYPTPDPSLVTDIDVNEFGALRGRDGGELELEVSRKAHLKYPPKGSGLKIPRSLFLYSATPTSTFTSPSTTSLSMAAKDGEDITPKTQAEEITKLMRRSLMLHEFKERRTWDEDLDPSAAVEERVQLSPIPTVAEPHEEEEVEARTVVEWLNETIDMSDTVR